MEMVDKEVEEIEINETKNSFNDWKNPPKVSDLKQDYQEAKSAHDSHVSDVNTWLDNLAGTGSAAVKDCKPGRSKIVPKLIRKQAEWRYASLSEPFLSTDELFNIDPVTYEDKASAVQNALVLNNQFNTKIDKVRFIDEYVRTAVDEGTVIVRVGWDFEEEEREVEVPDYAMVPVPQDPNVPMEMQGAVQLQQVQIGSHMEMQMVTIKNQPTVYVCDYHNVIIDPTCEGDLKKASFVIYSFETSLSELRKDGKYKNLDKIQLDQNNSVLASDDHEIQDDSSFTFKDEPRKKFVAYEYWGYWDIDGEGIVKPIVATYVGDVMIRLEENPFPDGALPFVAVSYLPVRKSIYGEPDGALLEDNQKIIGAVTRGMIDIMGRSANSQMGIRKDALDVTNRRRFDRGDDYEFNTTIDPRQGMYMHTYPEIPQSAQYMINMQNMEAESITGVKAFHSGISGSALGDTATGVRSALDAASKRELGILRRLADGIIQIGRKIIAMNAEFLSDTEVVRVTNEQFIEVRRDDLPGNYDLKLSISTAEADNQKAQELAFMLQTMGNNMDPEMSKMILSDIAKLRKMPDLAKRIEMYQPQPDPYMEQRKQLELKLLEAQAMNEWAKGQENQVDVQLKQAKTQNELAKAKSTSSDADLKDLKFIQEDRGVSHQRELEKEDMKRKTQLDLKAADAMLAPKKEVNT
jgi:hypothetical protein